MNFDQDVFLTELPVNWRFDRLKDIVRLRSEKTSESSELEDYLELEDIEAGTGRIINRRNTMGVESGITIFKKGDLLFGKLRPYLEKYYESEFDGKCTGEILAFKPERITSRFLFYCFASRWFIERCNALSYGAKMPRVSWPKQLSQFNIPLPPKHEQNRIAKYLDASCAAIDAAVDAKRHQLNTLEMLKKSTISQVITNGLQLDNNLISSGHEWLGDIPSHWRTTCLKRLLKKPLKYGLNEAAELEDRDLPRYIRITDFDEEGVLREDNFRSLPWEIAQEAILELDDVLFARSGATVGKTFIFRKYEGQACFAGYLIRARTMICKLNPLFLYYFTKTIQYDMWKSLIFTQATIQNISAVKYNYLPIPLPPIQEQKEICNFIESKTNEFNILFQQIKKQIQTLNAYRKSLIHECITGQRKITKIDLKVVNANG